jgi:rfaE bifunctional protein kinase chain/domain
MIPARLRNITSRYSSLRVAIVGDFCLDRYLEIDPAKAEISLETHLPVRNVVNVRSQPGGAGTILNNLLALGVGRIWPVSFCGEDGEGWELQRAMKGLPGVDMKHFFGSSQRRTFTYTKPLLLFPGKPPRELNRLDFKNWTPTPGPLRERLARSVQSLAGKVDAVIVLDQTDLPQTGVVTPEVLSALGVLARTEPKLLILADSRQGLRNFPPVSFKLNAAELASHIGSKRRLSFTQVESVAGALAAKQGRPVFVTLAERGIVGAMPSGEIEHIPALPVRGEIDIVGAGDAVTANLTASLAAGATMRESLEIANAAASVVIHKLGTTGTAGIKEIEKLLRPSAP